MAGGICSHCGIFKKSGVEDAVCRLCRNRGRANLAETREDNPPQLNPSPPPSPSVANSQPCDGILTRLREMKASNAAGQLDSKAMNEVLLDFMISMIDVNKKIGPLLDRVTVLEEIAARLEKIHPEDEVQPESSIAVANLPPEAGKPDGTLAGELITALGIGLTHVNVERVQRVGATQNADGTNDYPGKLLIELDTKKNKINCLGKRAKENLKNSDSFKNVKLYQALSKAQITDRHNMKELMKAANMVDFRLNGMGRIVATDGDERGSNSHWRERGRGRRGRGERGRGGVRRDLGRAGHTTE